MRRTRSLSLRLVTCWSFRTYVDDLVPRSWRRTFTNPTAWALLLLSDAHQCTQLFQLSWSMCLSNSLLSARLKSFSSCPKDMLVQLLAHRRARKPRTSVWSTSRRLNGWTTTLRGGHCHLPELLRTVRLALLPAHFPHGECLYRGAHHRTG